jgi:hypothetical protein
LLGCDHFLVYRSIDELQADLDAWITQYDETRPHQGRWCFKMPLVCGLLVLVRE